MKTKKVYTQMTKSPCLKLLSNAIVDENGEITACEQWITNGSAAYLLEGLPQFQADNLLNLLAVSEKNRKKYSVTEGNIRINGIVEPIYRDVCHDDIIVTPMCDIFGNMAMISEDKQTVVFVPDNFVDVFEDDAVTYVVRTSEGMRYVAARCGLICKGVVISSDYTSTSSAQEAIDRLRIIIREIDREKALT